MWWLKETSFLACTLSTWKSKSLSNVQMLYATKNRPTLAVKNRCRMKLCLWKVRHFCRAPKKSGKLKEPFHCRHSFQVSSFSQAPITIQNCYSNSHLFSPWPASAFFLLWLPEIHHRRLRLLFWKTLRIGGGQNFDLGITYTRQRLRLFYQLLASSWMGRESRMWYWFEGIHWQRWPPLFSSMLCFL